MKYTKHFVCFLDILGFKDSIIESRTNQEEFEKVFNVLKSIESTKTAFIPQNGMTFNYDNRTLFEFPQKMSMFSDSIIFSYEAENPRSDFADLYKIIFDLAFYCWNLLLLGEVFVRGGVAYGDLYHENDVCFGPALLEAIQIEKDAIYPRIAISPDIINYKSSAFPYWKNVQRLESDVKLRRTFAYYQREVLSTDLTGEIPIHYIDYLWRFLPMDRNAAIEIKSIIEKNLNQGYCDYILRKYIWFAVCFNFILNSYTEYTDIGNIDLSTFGSLDFSSQKCDVPDYLL